MTWTMSLDTWVSVATLLGFALTIVTTVLVANGRTRKELGAAIERLDDRVGQVDGKIDDVRTELKADITRLDGNIDDLRTELKADITRLDDRVFALAVGLKPLMEDARATGPAA